MEPQYHLEKSWLTLSRDYGSKLGMMASAPSVANSLHFLHLKD